tara:strand:+ start:452 stop:1069 length:618 start_codon:yes stop_codon:yes gene_type:complete
MIITIAGTAGSGKSTLAKNLIEVLNAKRIYVGGIRRVLAREKDMTLEELNEYAKNNPETDIDVDKKAAKEARILNEQGFTVIVEGRVQFYFLPESIKLFLKVSPLIAAQRIFQETKNLAAKEERNENTYRTVEDLAANIEKRTDEDTKRYLKYYQLDDGDENHYDFVLDTGNITKSEVLELVLEFLKKNSKNVEKVRKGNEPSLG